MDLQRPATPGPESAREVDKPEEQHRESQQELMNVFALLLKTIKFVSVIQHLVQLRCGISCPGLVN